MNYILKNKKVVKCDDILKWGKFIQDISGRRVAYTKLKECFVSTVFLGIDHNYGFSKKKLLFETMVFENKFSKFKYTTNGMKFHKPLDELTDRYSTWGKAEKGHKEIVNQINTK